GTTRSGRPSRSSSASVVPRPNLIVVVRGKRKRSASSYVMAGSRGGGARGGGPLPLHVAEQPRRRVPQGGPGDDFVHLAVLEEELRGLEAFGQILPDRLLDDPLARKADHRTGLRQDHVALHGEGGGDPAGGGV